ncbi:MAG: cob(I)yrinic acid a,c-diamide adenosyltransferase [Gemmatimonadetes bacterium]|nr:cob(I)yrinic acid a,c-diamide adenosyltransferase [Gemmatimonadota bacterium]MCY3943091.1 cob(I)yrinic acid a,c-diamide adenosyltransferase [Gemmatimonadota bacterium]
MRIYTRRGDSGRTALFGGPRVAKDDMRVEAYGTVDELNAAIGAAAAVAQTANAETSSPWIISLPLLQSDLFAIGAHLATPPPEGNRPSPRLPSLPSGRIAEMEEWIDEALDEAGPLRNFVLPGGSGPAASLHLARAVCRRAERRVVALAAASPVDPLIVRYLNRLSDYLFAAARAENALAGRGDVEWHQ